VVLFGAASAAQTILRGIGRADSGYVAVGCLDDNESKHGVRIHDVPVLGTVDQLPGVLRSKPAEEVLIAVPSATSAQMRRFIEICNQAKVTFRTVPALKDIIAGQVTMSQFREVSLEDLLGREPVQIGLDSVRREIERRVVLVTGAAGSIGSELCRQILNNNPERLICLDQSETGLFLLEHDLRSHPRAAQLACCVSVRFGNVLGSNGSVVPTLQHQLEKKQALTITHPDIKRFFMITSEAVALVLQGFVIGSHGDILVLDMGEPIRIVDLARTLI